MPGQSRTNTTPRHKPAEEPARRVLTVNGGSSSIKFALYRADSPTTRLLAGKIERIGLPKPTLTIHDGGSETAPRLIRASDHRAPAAFLIGWLDRHVGFAKVAGVGHRVVHGGLKLSEAQLITPQLMAELHRISPYDPEHMPSGIQLMEVFHQHQPQLPQVACFDTAFHRDMPRVAGPRAARGRLILAHLGNGASLAAVRNGKSIDTSMGFTPASGIPMSTRSGDLDPGLVWYLARTEHMTGKQFHEMVHRQSSLLGVSEISPDMRDLLAREAKDVRAAEAVALFCYQVKKWIGAFAAPSAGWTRSSSPAGLGKTPSRSVRGFATASNSWASGWTPGRTRRAHRSFPHGPVASRLGSSAPMRK